MSIFIRRTVFLLLLSGSAVTFASNAKTSEPEPLITLGWIENAYLIDPGFPLQTKLDTGAKTSSLDARVIKTFQQYGKRWVRFAVRNPETDKETVLVRERQRTIGIVQHIGGSEIRPTVNVDICIAGNRHNIEVSLVDRENFKYPLLLGRRALANIAVIHPGKTYISGDICPGQMHQPQSSPRPSQDESADEQDDQERRVDEVEATGENERSGSAEERSGSAR